VKLAVVMFGHLRTYLETVESLNKYVIKPFNADVFMHTWEYQERSTQSHQAADKSFQDMVVNSSELYKHYPRLTLLVEPELVDDEQLDYYGSKSILGLKSMHNSMAKAIGLVIDSGVIYDAVLIIRPDILIRSEVNLIAAEKYINAYPYPNYLYAGYFIDENPKNIGYLDKWGASDCMLLTNLRTLKLMSDLGDCSQIYTYPYTSWGESQFKYFMQSKNIYGRSWNLIAPRDWAIKRAGGEHSSLIIDLLMYMRKGIRSVLDSIRLLKRRF